MFMRGIKVILFASAAAGLFATCCGPVWAQNSTASFFAGKQIKLITHVGPASGYAVWARLIAAHLGRNIPGSPSIILQSMPGGGGVKAANYLFALAPKTGLELGAVNRLVPTLSIMGAASANFDSSQFGWLGSPTSESNLCVVTKAAPVRSIDDLLTKEVIVGTDGVGSGLHIFPTALNAVLGTKFKVIDGYKDSGDVLIAMDRGEIHGACQSAETLLNSRGEALRTGEWRPLLQGGLARHPDFPDVPFVIDYAKNHAQRQILEFLYASQSFGRPYLAPPGLPAERLAVLRAAFEKTMRDPDFLGDATRQKLKVSPISGAVMDQMIAELKAVPKEIVATVARLTGNAGGN
jgi:tripartite-type tricarboxylate transporter receptor subunit TctC